MTAATPGLSVATGRTEVGTGTGALLRFLLRRDRVKLPAWTASIGAFALYYAVALPAIFGTEGDLSSVAPIATGPVGALFGGPGYGYDELTIERFMVGQYGLYFLLTAALMSILLVVRHTRAEEQQGRAELLGATVVGAAAPLGATLILAVITNAAVVVVVAAVLVVNGYAVAGSAVFAVGIGAAGLTFAGVAAVAAQVTSTSRSAAGLAGAALGVAFVVRAVGDLIGENGSLLSWLSPLAWSQQTRAFVDERWWPLGLSLLVFGVLAAVALRTVTRRDLGAALLGTRPGPAHAAPGLRSAVALSARLQRPAIIGWAVPIGLGGLMYGGITRTIDDSFADMPEEMLAVMGGGEDLLRGYLGTMGFFTALLVCVFALLAVHAARGEEAAGRVEVVLATPTSRVGWLGGHLAVAGLGSVVMLVVGGLTLGVGAAIVTDDPALVWELTVAHLVHLPAVLAITAVGVALFGLAPRALGLAWVVVVHAGIMGFFGPLMDLPGWVEGLSPLEHSPRMPLAPFTATPLLVLSAVGAALVAVGLRAFAARDLRGR